MSSASSRVAPRVVIVGAGSAGLSVAARLSHALPAGSVTVCDPAAWHWYQPLFTLVGGGDARLADCRRPMKALIPPGVTWRQEAVTAFAPETRQVRTTSGVLDYDFLVVCPGLTVDYAAIPGLEAALAAGQACTNYSERHVEGTWRALQGLTEGTALFTFPNTPVKCAGAPQKIAYLADDHLRRAGRRAACRVVFATAGEKIFGVKKYAEALEGVVRARGIETLFRHTLVAVDGDKRLATFRAGPDGDEVRIPYAFLHVTPPMRAPDVVAKSALASPQGWVDVDKHTLRHVSFPDVFALGDASSLPTSKTGAAIRKQAPVLVANLLAAARGQELPARYDGYSSCPLVTGYGKLILAEFDYDGRPAETFPFDQAQERWSLYQLKKHVLPRLYWHGMLQGRF